MNFNWDEQQLSLADDAATVATRAVAEFGSFSDAWMNGFSKEFSLQLGERGWIGMTWPVEYGGGGHAPVDRFIVSEAMLAVGAPVAASWFADRQIGPSLIAFGTSAQREQFLPGILSGTDTWCIGMSEPDAGSDVASLRTRARRGGDGAWYLSGQKIWTSFAAKADYCYVICRTGDSQFGHEGISELIVPMNSPGLTVRVIEDAAGGRHFCEVFFDEVRVPAENLVGTEGAAFQQTMRQLEHERGGIDRLLSNRVLFEHARSQAGKDPRFFDEILHLETDYHVGRLLVLRESLRQGGKGFSAISKTFCTSHEQRVADFTWRVLGLDALLWTVVTRGLAYSPSYTIMGGTNEILRNIIGERILRLPR